VGAVVGGGEFSAEASAKGCFSFFFLVSEISRSRRLGGGRLLVLCQYVAWLGGGIVGGMIAVFLELGRDAFGGDKDEPSVDATCEETGRPSGPLRLTSSGLAAGDGLNVPITRKGSRKEGADGPSAA